MCSGCTYVVLVHGLGGHLHDVERVQLDRHLLALHVELGRTARDEVRHGKLVLIVSLDVCMPKDGHLESRLWERW